MEIDGIRRKANSRSRAFSKSVSMSLRIASSAAIGGSGVRRGLCGELCGNSARTRVSRGGAAAGNVGRCGGRTSRAAAARRHRSRVESGAPEQAQIGMVIDRKPRPTPARLSPVCRFGRSVPARPRPAQPVDDIMRLETQPPVSADTPIGITLTINGQRRELQVAPWTTLLDLLRERLDLTGTKKGCDHGQCGACTVLVNGTRVNSCLTLAVMKDGAEITDGRGARRPRRPGGQQRPSPDPGGVHRARRLPVRLLHAGPALLVGRPDERGPRPHTGRDPRGDERQHLAAAAPTPTSSTPSRTSCRGGAR